MKTKNTKAVLKKVAAGQGKWCKSGTPQGLAGIRDIHLKVVSQDEHREKFSLGDYWIDSNGVLQVRASKLPDNRMSILLLIHELIEVLAAEHKGIPEPVTQAWDIAFEKRCPGSTAQAGDEDDCPIREQHLLAEGIERIMAVVFGVSWKQYGLECDKL